jgi:hypothetical protein
MKRPSIPALTGLPEALVRVLGPMKEAIESIRGERSGQEKLTPLADGASTAEIIAKVNAIIERISR